MKKALKVIGIIVAVYILLIIILRVTHNDNMLYYAVTIPSSFLVASLGLIMGLLPLILIVAVIVIIVKYLNPKEKKDEKKDPNNP